MGLGRLPRGLGHLLLLLRGRSWRRSGGGQRVTTLRKAVLHGRIDRLHDLPHGRAVKVPEALHAELVEQGIELGGRLLRDRAFETGHPAGVVLRLRDDAAEVEARQRSQVERHEVSAERGRGDVLDDEGRDAVEVLERLEPVSERVLAGLFEREVVGRLEDTLQGAAQREGRPVGIGQVAERLGELRHGGDADLVEIEEALEELGERLLGDGRRRVLEAAGEEHLVEERPCHVRRDRLVLRPQRLVQLGDQRAAGRGLLRHDPRGLRVGRRSDVGTGRRLGRRRALAGAGVGSLRCGHGSSRAGAAWLSDGVAGSPS